MIVRAVVMAVATVVGGVAHAASPAGRWIATEIGGLPVARGVETTLDLDVEGGVSGRGGCNAYGGRATIREGAVEFGPMRATRMACPAPETDQEGRFHRALTRAASWRLDGDRLELVDRDGGTVARFLRRR